MAVKNFKRSIAVFKAVLGENTWALSAIDLTVTTTTTSTGTGAKIGKLEEMVALLDSSKMFKPRK